ncbi:hypothetical protein [Streptomyces colonosanans]|uniref:hypothetical protein n=1 Tax=Streptomyces colonosanans TaxID=1428652 RepID=UPI001C430511|nr:hypothetical protein [Streptomyces colonosanans]
MRDVASKRDVDDRPAVTERLVTLTVNGRSYTLRLDTRVTLLDALRDLPVPCTRGRWVG